MGIAMRDCFDFSFYWELLDGLMSTHRALRFVDVADDCPEDPFFILRHDVDYLRSQLAQNQGGDKQKDEEIARLRADTERLRADAQAKIAQLQERIKELNQKLMAAAPVKK